jgi:pSer/pThr/pTyr-binding forkhead associated (FHA) protein
MVEDLGSTNGTFHNGNRLSGSRLLHPGDRIQVGTTLIEAQ